MQTSSFHFSIWRRFTDTGWEFFEKRSARRELRKYDGLARRARSRREMWRVAHDSHLPSFAQVLLPRFLLSSLTRTKTLFKKVETWVRLWAQQAVLAHAEDTAHRREFRLAAHARLRPIGGSDRRYYIFRAKLWWRHREKRTTCFKIFRRTQNGVHVYKLWGRFSLKSGNYWENFLNKKVSLLFQTYV